MKYPAPQSATFLFVAIALGLLIASGDPFTLARADALPKGITNADWTSIRAAHRTAKNACLTVDEYGGKYPLAADSVAQQAYVKASNTDTFDNFGLSVAISGNTAVVGASGEASSATGVNGDQSDNSAFAAGAAYIFVREGDTWTQQAYLKASNTDFADYFGSAVAISGDTVVVAAAFEDSKATGINGEQGDNSGTNSGAAYVFVRNGTTWTQQAYLKASNTEGTDEFGRAVAISGDTVVVSAWLEDSNANGVNGNQSDNSTPESGAVYVFTRNGTAWSQQAYLKASNTGLQDYFGSAVAISGETILVAANGEWSSAIGINGDQTDNSALSAGAAYIFVRNGNTWSQQAYVKASNTNAGDSFGSSVAISENTAIVGAQAEDSSASGINGDQVNDSASEAGAAYVFVRDGTNWSQQAYLKASNTDAGDGFGHAVSVSGDVLIVGAFGESSSATGADGDQADNSASQSGSAYVFVRKGDNWIQQSYLKASNTEATDFFGYGVAISGNIAMVGADLEDSNATGIDGNQSDNSLSTAGAAYAFTGLGPDTLLNISTRANVGTGDNVLIGGFIITGTEPKKVAVRAIGPSLGAFGVTGALANPVLELHGPGDSVTTNDDWKDTQESEIAATGLGPTDELESAIVTTLEAGAYTAIVRGSNGGTGVALVEAYDLNQAVPSQLGNISTRGFVATGDNVMIGGFILGEGFGGADVIVRGIGPSLAAVGVTDPLPDPMLELHEGNGMTIATNDDWGDSPDKQAIIDSGLAPTNGKESALLAHLLPGAYTAILSGIGSGSGVALIEAYRLR